MTATAASLARALRVQWGGVTLGGAAVLAVFGGLVASGAGGALAEHAEVAFYLAAAVSMAGLAAAFAFVRTLETKLRGAGSDAEAGAVVRTNGILALALVNATAVVAGVAAFLTGDPMPLAFGLPLFAFAGLTWPSDGRVAHWLALRER